MYLVGASLRHACMQVTEMASLIRLEREAREAARFAGIDSGGHIMCFGELLQRALSTAPSPDIVAPAAVHSDRGRILVFARANVL